MDAFEVFPRAVEIEALARPVLAHRVHVKPHSRVQGMDGTRVVEEVLRKVEVPVDFEPR
jgi:MoxR-like ATPase